jgi:tRNA(Ile)-lysidine synthase
VSGGADSTALAVLAVAAGCTVTIHHVDHGIRPDSADDVEAVRATAERLDVPLVLHHVQVEHGPNLEARARAARYGALPADVLTGHTADDQAETVLLRLVRGAGADGLAAMTPGPTRPLLALRRHETRALCDALGLRTVDDPMNLDPAHQRVRVRSEVLPLLADIARRDVVPLLARTADLLRDDDHHLDAAAAAVDPTDARALAAAPTVLARRAVRRWLTVDGYPPDLATVERVLAVARGEHVGCEIGRGRSVRRSGQRLCVVPDGQ